MTTLNRLRSRSVATVLIGITMWLSACMTDEDDTLSFGQIGTENSPLPYGEAILIEAEDYTAFFDITAENEGGAYRNDTVDVETCSEGGFSVGWIEAGEWLEYLVVNDTEDDFNISARVSSPQGSTSAFRMVIDGVDVAAQADIPATPSWQSWVDAPIGQVHLTPGEHRIRLEFAGGFNLNYVYLASATNPPLERPLGNLPPLPEVPVDYVGPVETFGQLAVAGTQLVSQTGQPVQLKGVSSHGLQWYPWISGYTIQNLAYTWGVQIVRPAMYVEEYKNDEYWGGYTAHPEYMQTQVENAIDDAVASSVYVVIDWHIHNDPLLFVDAALAYFTDMSARYGHLPNIIYEICNEPEYVDWANIKAYADQVIPAIRANDPDGLILVGTPQWCQSPDQVLADPIVGHTNVMYSFHFYAGAHDQKERDKAETALAAGLPLFVSEWGVSDYSGGTNDLVFLDESDVWVDWMDRHGLSGINWSFSNKGESSASLNPGVSLAGPWAPVNLSASGLFTQRWINE